MKRILRVVALCGAILFSVAPAFAHHGYAAYDMKVTQSLTGKVTDYLLANPHSTVSFEVKDAKGKTEEWTAEAGHVRLMQDLGWTRTTLKPGDVATFFFHPAKNGSHAVDLVKVVFADGKTLFVHTSGEGPSVE